MSQESTARLAEPLTVTGLTEDDLAEQARRQRDAEQRMRVEFAERATAAYEWLLNQSTHVVDAMCVLRVRCPIRGCLLAEIFRFPEPDGGERFLARTITTLHSHAAFLTVTCWTYEPAPLYPAGCRHGQALVEHFWLDDLVGLVRGWTGPRQTVEQLWADAPESERRGIRRRTFHPPASAWRPKPRYASR
jgi:hypothetical protein